MKTRPFPYRTAQIEGANYASVADAALYLQLSEVFVYRLLHKRNSPLRTIDFAGRVLVEVASLEEERTQRQMLKKCAA